MLGSAEAYFKHGYESLCNRDLDIAIDDFTQSLLLGEERDLRARAYLNRGVARYLLGEYEAAITDYTAAIALDPEYTDAYYSRGGAYDDMGLLNAAIINYKKALELSPYRADIHNDLGVAQLVRGNIHAAVDSFTHTLLLTDDWNLRAVAHYNRGNARYRCGYHDAAITDYTASIRLDSRDAKVFSKRAAVLNHSGDYNGAFNDCAEALRRDDQHAYAYLVRANTHQECGDIVAALADYQRYLELGGGKLYGDQIEIETIIRDLHENPDQLL